MNNELVIGFEEISDRGGANMVSFTLSYSGGLADNNVIDMYDAARGVAGFHRSLALTTHLLMNGEIITQAPSLKGAQIIVTTPEEGSWKITAVVLAGIWAAATAPKDTIAGHLLFSAYDYVISQTLGFNVDYEKSLGQLYDEHLSSKKITAEKMDSLIEKTENSIADIHRPIVSSKTAKQADLFGFTERTPGRKIGPHLTINTFEYMSTTIREDQDVALEGVVSSFNINTFKGRIFVFVEERPIPFELANNSRRVNNLIIITDSLRANAENRNSRRGAIRLTARRFVSKTGRLKAMIVSHVEPL